MTTKRKVEVFSAGCSVCEKTIAMVEKMACPACDVEILDMNDPKVAARAERLGVRSVPAVAVDGKLVECCTDRGPDKAALLAAGIGME